MIPSDLEALTDLVDGEDYQESDNVNNPANKLARLAAFILGTGLGSTQSHNSDLISMLTDNYIGGRCYKKDANNIYISPFTGIITNAAGTVKKLRVSTSVTTLAAAALDTGSFAANTYYYIYATADAAATTPTFIISASASAPTGYTYYRKIGWFYNETINILDITGGKISTFIGGNNEMQVVSTIVSAMATGSTAAYNDNTIPQNTEGDQFMSLSIIPTSAVNRLRIAVTVNFSSSSGDHVVIGLFQDSVANALAANLIAIYDGSYSDNCVTFVFEMIAGTTSAITFKVRIGSTNGRTITFNGTGGAAKLGGVMPSSITITEIKS